MQYFETSDTFLSFLERKISDIGHTPSCRLESLIISIYKQRVTEFDKYNLSLSREASIEKYSDSRDRFLSTKEMLLERLAKDMIEVSTSASIIYEISQILANYSTELEEVTSGFIEIMPMDTLEIHIFPDPDIYKETLFEESSWIEGEAQSMRIILSKWMDIHKSEVAGEKEKLSLLMQDNKLSNIIGLIQTTGSLIDESIAKVIDTL